MRHHTAYCCLLAGLLLCTVLPSTVQAQPDAASYNALLDSWLTADRDGRYRDAEKYARQIKAIDEQFFPEKFGWRLFLGNALVGQGRFKEAQPLLESYVDLCRRNHGPHLFTVEGLTSLSALYLPQHMLKEARSTLEEAVPMALKVLGPDHENTLNVKGNLALLYAQQGELPRAVALLREVIDGQHRRGSQDPDRLLPILNLVSCYMRQGRYEDAESMARYGMNLAQSLGASMDNPRLIMLVHNLGSVYVDQNRAAEARPLLEAAMSAAERNLGPGHYEVGNICGDLSNCYIDLDQRQKGVQMLQRAIDILSSTLGASHPMLGVKYYNLGWLYIDTGKPAEAESMLRKALDVAEQSAGAHHWQTAQTRTLLAGALLEQDKDNEAEAQLKLALTDLETEGIGESHRHSVMRTQARLSWKRGDKAAAVKRLQEAIELADASRAFFGGAEIERAAASSEFTATYEMMLRWQVELGNVAGAFEALEKARARTFLESMNLAGNDLLQGRTAEEKAHIRQREAELTNQVSKLENELNDSLAPSKKEDPAATQQRRALHEALRDARAELYKFQRDLRSSSPVYRQAVSIQAKAPSLAEVQQQLVPEKTILLSYHLGSTQSFVLAIRATDARLLELKLADDEARRFGLAAGPLTRDRVDKMLLGETEGAVLANLSRRGSIDDLLPKLHALWQVLVPQELREEICDGGLERLVIVPDGALALLPMEALVVSTTPTVTYLLDVAPPIQYGPSAAVLMSLVARPAAPSTQQPVLTLGDPQYGRPQPAAQNNLLAQAARGSRSATLRQRLAPLPHSGLESRWVAEVFKKSGADSILLLGANATEAQVRAHISGREIVHLACHGTSDDAYGNFFGMLAMAPGPQPGNPLDDGMLTMAEIYGLNLRGCELAILSACMTNHGPEQRGEGIWALSRGFLVAGARRVIASDWVVDDEAGASLISVCCSQLADARKNQQSPDYGRALWKAKTWVRKQDKWQHPFFWASFVLVGPN